MILVQDPGLNTIFEGILVPGEGGLFMAFDYNTGVTLQVLGTPENSVYNFTLIIDSQVYPNIIGEIAAQ
jgi:hypothetical protein